MLAYQSGVPQSDVMKILNALPTVVLREARFRGRIDVPGGAKITEFTERTSRTCKQGFIFKEDFSKPGLKAEAAVKLSAGGRRVSPPRNSTRQPATSLKSAETAR